MASGCPVVAARAGALPETCGDAALLVDPADPGAVAGALESLAAGPTPRRELLLRGEANLARFSWKAHARGVRGLYERALASPA
jgi:glycosyltransferase involved in cell wall biosynthesis